MSVFKKLSIQCTLVRVHVHIRKLSLRAAVHRGKSVNNCINAGGGVRSVDKTFKAFILLR